MGRGRVQRMSLGRAIMFFFSVSKAFYREDAEFRPVPLAYDMSPFPFPMNMRVFIDMILFRVVTLVFTLAPSNKITKSSFILKGP